MKILGQKEKVFNDFIEEYYLDDVYAGQSDEINIGVLILYLLIEHSQISFHSIMAEAEVEEIGVPHNIVSIGRSTFSEYCSSLDILCKVFKAKELREWILKCNVGQDAVEFSGSTFGLRVGVSYGMKSHVNVIPILHDVEVETYNYHNYDDKLIDVMKQRFNMSQKVTIQTLVELEKYVDIYEEFLEGVKSNPFIFSSIDAIEVEGYTAEKLHREFPLSELGAYNYLIYLREKPEEALKDLRKGLPRR